MKLKGSISGLVLGLVLSLLATPLASTTSSAAESSIRRIPLVASYAERLALVMSVSSDGSSWFSECRLPMTGRFASAEQLMMYLNTQDNMCNVLSNTKFQVGDETQIKGIQSRFNETFTKQFADQQSSAPWTVALHSTFAILMPVLFYLDMKNKNTLGMMLTGFLSYVWIQDSIQTWIDYLEIHGVVPPMIENLVGVSRGTPGVSPDVARTVFFAYRKALIEATR